MLHQQIEKRCLKCSHCYKEETKKKKVIRLNLWCKHPESMMLFGTTPTPISKTDCMSSPKWCPIKEVISLKLKSIEIHGFMNFNDKKVFNLNQQILPEYKNDVAYALSWVIGRINLKTREVILMPSGFAEVSLLIDNSEKTLPIKDTEVMLTRRMFRYSASEFFINRVGCCLKDIKGLIKGTEVRLPG